jgi:DNA-binding NtrC family response regulator
MKSKLRVLVVDDDRMMARTLRDILRVKGYDAEAVHSGPKALEKVKREAFDCVLSDIKMPGVNGVELYRAIKVRRPDLPVVLMTAYSSDRLVQEGLAEGVIASLTKPLDINLLLGFFSSLRRERSIVIVDDDPQFCRTLGDILRARGFAVIPITDPHGVVERVGTNGQVVLLDLKLNGVNGSDVLQEIRERYPHVPVILVTGYRREMAAVIEAALKTDAYTCLYKPLQIEELLQTLTRIHHQGLGRMLGRRYLRGEKGGEGRSREE